MMRKLMMILGTILIATILISGSAVAVWYYIFTVTRSQDCTDINNIIGAPDNDYATIGQSNPNKLGWAVLDLGEWNAMGPSQDFRVFANSSVEEEYNVSVAETAEDDGVYVGDGEDTQNCDFTTPSTPGKEWRYIIIRGWSGVTGDLAYGPDIDAVGWFWIP